jgi:hypothetical protein
MSEETVDLNSPENSFLLERCAVLSRVLYLVEWVLCSECDALLIFYRSEIKYLRIT